MVNSASTSLVLLLPLSRKRTTNRMTKMPFLMLFEAYAYIFRVQYAIWKEECRQMFPVIGSGRFITAPVINEDGEPIQDPLVLLEANPDKGILVSSEHRENGIDSSSELSTGNTSDVNSRSSYSSEMVKDLSSQNAMDKKVIQWKLTLHQIGWWHLLYFVIVNYLPPLFKN